MNYEQILPPYPISIITSLGREILSLKKRIIELEKEISNIKDINKQITKDAH